MQTKIQELTEKIYNEGVQKAKTDAENIVNKAHDDAEAIERNAAQTAEKIIDDAQKQAQMLKEHVETELKMSINQAVSALKQELTSLVTMQAVQSIVKESFTDVSFVQKLIETAVKGWADKEIFDLNVILPETQRIEMETFFKNRMLMEMNNGLEITFTNSVKSGFKVEPVGDSYRLTFTDADFINFFKSYLRPKTSELLFDKKK
ncbi:MAG: hypothetical protein LBV41_09015 [Cytophagaceae bacterium]|jgi:V/A-type H+-transporting ATPase subunit E|nr:hypothetical protein [Cytophagaceae bacterium]